ncbi:MAG: amidohydrolase family protein [Chitinophagaceae bacterium]|nr:amidohydrolase family protein [Chitinophagaceae bacterium]MCW5925896.1 amidohydrolase family protein [Chitinophagaceae bacterium]
MYLKFQADHIFSDGTLLDKDFVLITDASGRVLDITEYARAGEDIQQFSGIITPGHINCHCHLELSYMKSAIPEKTGLTSFIGSVMKMPPASPEEKLNAMALADEEMYRCGIVAVGDISNHGLSISQKTRSAMYWFNFLEISNLDDEKAADKLELFKDLRKEFQFVLPNTTLSPHAAYSVSAETFRLINRETEGGVITIHNQECRAEDELFLLGTGKFTDFYQSLGRTTLPVGISGKSSLQTWLPYFDREQTILLVHNTFTTEEDIVFALDYAAQRRLQLYFCLCPNANMYIEQSLPPVELLLKHDCRIVLGTDSYASNRQLSILKEATTLQRQFPGIPLPSLLQWMTANGARALGLTGLGNFSKGTKPGVTLIDPGFSHSRRLI